MKKNNKSCLLILFVILSTFSFFTKLYGSESTNFLSLKNNEVKTELFEEESPPLLIVLLTEVFIFILIVVTPFMKI